MAAINASLSVMYRISEASTILHAVATSSTSIGNQQLCASRRAAADIANCDEEFGDAID
jgi:hypothetical protein